MMQAWWMFCLCSVIFVTVSLLTPKPDIEKIRGVTWSSPLAVLTQGKIQGWSDPRLLSGGLLAMLVVLYYIFR